MRKIKVTLTIVHECEIDPQWFIDSGEIEADFTDENLITAIEESDGMTETVLDSGEYTMVAEFIEGESNDPRAA